MLVNALAEQNKEYLEHPRAEAAGKKKPNKICLRRLMGNVLCYFAGVSAYEHINIHFPFTEHPIYSF